MRVKTTIAKLWAKRPTAATEMEEEGLTQHRDSLSPALTTPKMPIPEPMVVIVGMMSNFPAWRGTPGRNGFTVRSGPVGKGFLRSPKARPGTWGHLLHCQLAPQPAAQVLTLQVTQQLAGSPGF